MRKEGEGFASTSILALSTACYVGRMLAWVDDVRRVDHVCYAQLYCAVAFFLLFSFTYLCPISRLLCKRKIQL